jgi:hypothetical protein
MADDGIFSRVDELRLFALRAATEDKFHLDMKTAEENRNRVVADAKAYYAFLTEKEPTSE